MNLNYARPTFFALEAMPIAVDIARSLALQMYDPQGAGEPMALHTADALVESWRANNESAVRALVADGSAPIGEGSVKAIATVEQTTYWWRYAQAKPGIEERLEAEDIFTPQLIFVRAKGSTKVERLVFWPDCISELIPETELLMIRRHRPGPLGLGKREENGVVRFQEMKEGIGRSHGACRRTGAPSSASPARDEPRSQAGNSRSCLGSV